MTGDEAQRQMTRSTEVLIGMNQAADQDDLVGHIPWCQFCHCECFYYTMAPPILLLLLKFDD